MPFLPFDYTLDFTEIDFRERPDLYRVGKGEQGVLMIEPYKSEILKYWRFKTPADARESSAKIYKLFLGYKKQRDFVGMDMARKFIQMGYTRARRYTNHAGGRKYSKETGEVLPYTNDPVKAEAAAIFFEQWRVVREDADYLRMKDEHRARYEQVDTKTTRPRAPKLSAKKLAELQEKFAASQERYAASKVAAREYRRQTESQRHATGEAAARSTSVRASKTVAKKKVSSQKSRKQTTGGKSAASKKQTARKK